MQVFTVPTEWEEALQRNDITGMVINNKKSKLILLENIRSKIDGRQMKHLPGENFALTYNKLTIVYLIWI